VALKIPFTKQWFADINEFIGFDLGDLTGEQSEQKLIDKGYGQNVTVYAIIKKIAQSGADIPKVLIDENNPDEIIEDGEVFDMLQEPAILQGEVISQFDVSKPLFSEGYF